MPRLAVEEVLRKATEARSKKDSWRGLISECWRHAAPGMNPYAQGTGSGQPTSVTTAGVPQHDDLFDATLARATIRRVNRTMTDVFPAGRNWAKLTEGEYFAPELGRQETRRGNVVEQIEEKVFGAIHASDFYLDCHRMVFEGFVAGTGLMKVGQSPDPSRLIGFEAVTERDVALEGGPRSQVWGYYREMNLLPSEIRSLWPEASKLPEDPDPASGERRRRTVHDCTYYDPDTGVWFYDVILEGDEDRRRIVEEDLLVCPWICWRYQQMVGETQGRSPVMAALPDARTLEHAIRIRLEAASIRAVGAYTYTEDTVFNPRLVKMESGALIPVGSNDTANPTIRPLELSGDVQLNEIVLEDLREAINKTMLNHELPPMTGAVRSATEILERQREAMSSLGGPYFRLVEEVGRPVLRAVAYELTRRGHLPALASVSPRGKDKQPMPLVMDGTDVAVTFVSPLVTAEQLADADSIVRWAEMSQVAAGEAAWMGGAKVEDIPEALAEKLGVSSDLVRKEGEREAKMQEAMGMQEQVQQEMAP